MKIRAPSISEWVLFPVADALGSDCSVVFEAANIFISPGDAPGYVNYGLWPTERLRNAQLQKA